MLIVKHNLWESKCKSVTDSWSLVRIARFVIYIKIDKIIAKLNLQLIVIPSVLPILDTGGGCQYGCVCVISIQPGGG